jgi:anthranilate synthase component 2
MLLIIDHYDSFSAMIADYCHQLGANYQMLTTDQISEETLTELKPEHIIIGPGPGHPNARELDATKKLMRTAIYQQIPLLGICLGHQLIGEIYGARVITATQISHGIICEIQQTGSRLFNGLPERYWVTRYHSLLIEAASLRTTELQITATTAEHEVMAIEHPNLPVFGIQFHPESVSSEYGLELMANFLAIQNKS